MNKEEIISTRKTLAKINPQFIPDPVLIESCKLLFDIANKEGLNGVRLTNLKFLFPDGKDPCNSLVDVSCEVYVNYEEDEKTLPPNPGTLNE